MLAGVEGGLEVLDVVVAQLVEPEVEEGRGRCDQVVCLEAVVAHADCVRQTRQDPFVHASQATKSIGVLRKERLASMDMTTFVKGKIGNNSVRQSPD